MARVSHFLHWLATPIRAVIKGIMVLVNLNETQMKALLTVGMLFGMFSLSVQTWFFLSMAEHAVQLGTESLPYFLLIQEQARINSALVAWFAVILGLIVFGADYFRAKMGSNEIGVGKRQAGEGDQQ